MYLTTVLTPGHLGRDMPDDPSALELQLLSRFSFPSALPIESGMEIHYSGPSFQFHHVILLILALFLFSSLPDHQHCTAARCLVTVLSQRSECVEALYLCMAIVVSSIRHPYHGNERARTDN